jgi:hypothetical protein
MARQPVLHDSERVELLDAALACVAKPFLLAGILAGDLGADEAVIAVLDTAIAWQRAGPRILEIRAHLADARAAHDGKTPPKISGFTSGSYTLCAVYCARSTLEVISGILGKPVTDVWCANDVRTHYQSLKAARHKLPYLDPGTMEQEIARELRFLVASSRLNGGGRPQKYTKHAQIASQMRRENPEVSYNDMQKRMRAERLELPAADGLKSMWDCIRKYKCCQGLFGNPKKNP